MTINDTNQHLTVSMRSDRMGSTGKGLNHYVLARIREYYQLNGCASTEAIEAQLTRTNQYCRTVRP